MAIEDIGGGDYAEDRQGNDPVPGTEGGYDAAEGYGSVDGGDGCSPHDGFDDELLVSDLEGDGGDVKEPLEPDDMPGFDVLQFEAAAQARAAEFVAQAARLAVFDGPEESQDEWITAKEASYDLPDTTRIEILQEADADNSNNVTTKLRITQPPAEMMCLDGILRRVTLSRSVLHASFIDFGDTGDTVSDLPEDPEEDAKFDAQGCAVLEAIGRARMEDQLDPGYRPGELIWARSNVVVECKLPNSPNFRTERYSESMPIDTWLSHIAARRHAGERVDQPPYDVAEHQALMALLDAIDPTLVEPQPLEDDFRIDWNDRQPTLRSWIP